MRHFFKSQLFPTYFIRVKHAKWACNILTFVPCGIWATNILLIIAHLHSACKSRSFPVGHTWLIHSSVWPGDRLPGATEPVFLPCTSAHVDLPHLPTCPWDTKLSHLHLNMWQTAPHSQYHFLWKDIGCPGTAQAGRHWGQPRWSPLGKSGLWNQTNQHWNLGSFTYSLQDLGHIT